MPSEYYLNNRPLSDFGFVPGHAEGSNLAVSGAWDLPARTGECYHAWPEEDGVEPYVDAEDLVFGSREIRLSGTIIGRDRLRFRELLEAFHAFITSLPSLVELRCAWGTWSVNCKAETKIEVKGGRIGFVTLVFDEPNPDLSGTMPRQWILATRFWNYNGIWENRARWYDTAEPGVWILDTGTWDNAGIWNGVSPWYGSKRTDIDDWRWASIGLILSAADNASVIPAAREIGITQPERETLYVPGGREPRSLTLTGWLVAVDMADFGERVRSLYWIFGSEGLRAFHHHGRIYDCFACEGFTLTGIQKREKVYAKFKIKLLESGNR